MNNLKAFLCWILSAFICNYLSAQQDNTKLPTIIPASPNAAELGRYGNFSAGLNTGSANIHIPLLSFQNGLCPISLDYSATGVKVDQIASRAGLGFVLNVGGVITRSVMGKIDELTTHITPNCQVLNQTLLNNLYDITDPNIYGKESEPDLYVFNFEGHSGKFLFDSLGNIVQLPYSDLKIQNGFIITTGDGTQYHFDMEEESSSYSLFFGQANSPITPTIPTAWYLSSINLPSGDNISFNYSDTTFTYLTGVSETLLRTYDGQNQAAACNGANACGQIDQDNMSKSVVTVQSKVLTSISYKSEQIVFSYVNRTDVPGDKLYSNIKYLVNGTVLKSIDFAYTVVQSQASTHSYFQDPELRLRPFLQSVTESGSNLQEVRKHTFTYNDMNGLPNRLSFSQDEYGFYNGKSNAYFVPLPNNIQDQQMFWRATADRSSDVNYAIKGSLASIKYPTGGTLSINYENNTISDTQTNAPTMGSTVTNMITPVALNQVQQSSVFTLPNYNQALTKYTVGMLTTFDPNDPPSNHPGDYMLFEIVKNSNGSVVFSRSLTYGQNVTASLNTLVGGTAYYVRITALNIDQNIRRYSATLTYPTSDTTIVQVNKPVGGLRVNRMITTDGAGNSEIHRYIYAYLSDSTKSSGKIRFKPQYKVNNEIETQMLCGGETGTHLEPVAVSCYSAYMYSSSARNIYDYGQYHINYESVLESVGDNFEGGGTEHLYNVQADLVGQIEFGSYILAGSKISVTGHFNGLEMRQTLFKKSGTNFVNVKKIENTYALDSAVNKTVYAYDVKKRYDYPLNPGSFDPVQLSGYDVQKYRYESRWVKKSSATTTEYDPQGVAILVSTQNYTYGNPLHTQITQTVMTNSEGQTIKETNLYPHEMVSLGKDPAGVYQGMINQNKIEAVIEKTTFNNNVQTAFSATHYASFTPGGYLPQYIQTQRKSSEPVENRIQFLAYDNNKNLLSVSKDNGPKLSYLWNYTHSFPVAECKNADISQIAYTSFEADATGNWNGIVAGNVSSTYSITGKNSYSQSGFNLTRTGLTATNYYIVSYWTRNSSAYSVSGTQSGYPIKGRTVDGWTYYEHLVTGITSIAVSGSGYIDELRTYPQNALMSTYTYDPGFGKTSQCDMNNIITYYEYDAFQRLYLIRDLDKNIVKKFVYDYFGSPNSEGNNQ